MPAAYPVREACFATARTRAVFPTPACRSPGSRRRPVLSDAAQDGENLGEFVPASDKLSHKAAV